LDILDRQGLKWHFTVFVGGIAYIEWYKKKVLDKVKFYSYATHYPEGLKHLPRRWKKHLPPGTTQRWN
jgi:hypothetical protein